MKPAAGAAQARLVQPSAHSKASPPRHVSLHSMNSSK
eukprot:CAMPEP_0205922640 /NCGR_PEP_ID=MMETSP1325-20131115/14817_1 /ASSEMBLY_ACC=CAM_ASM_000708 /TAXON_ID=236786 /ORGANISM="Florenciella sp., Strain RCC1007" /LENGTH=36 /DNA_ID= /DNA_START= /DNA_END= /DNA_ORIENTATION=